MLLALKALHLIFAIAWFAGLFYLFRLLVYHAENAGEPRVTGVLVVMARRLYRGIMTPAAVATWVGGLAMLWLNPGYLALGWVQLKLGALVLLVGYHLWAGYARARFARGDVFLTPLQCRIWNEIPLVFLIAIVVLAVLRPSLG